MIAPGIDVSPPRITTGSAFSATSESENWTPSLQPQMTPATSATKPATDQTMTQMRSSGMPIDCAAWWSSATARSARPVAVFWKKSASSGDQHRGDHRRVQVFLVDQEAALERLLEA